jgi:putative membrane protein
MNAIKPLTGFAEFWRNHTLRGLTLAYAFVWIATAIKPVNRQDWLLENLLVFGTVPVLVATFRRFRFSNLSYGLITLFLTLHAFGAHYTYSEMPIGNWLRDDWQFSRNHYDRVVHFLFGLLISYPLGELLGRVVGLRRGWARVGAVHVVMAWSALYEMIEGAVAAVVSPELGAAYNGIQGDIWDAQKDAALAMTGAVLAMTFTALQARRVATTSQGHTESPPTPSQPPTANATSSGLGKDLIAEGAIYVASLSLVSFLWQKPMLLLLCLVTLSALMLCRWHQRSDVFFYLVGFVLGPLGEAMAVHFGAWAYAQPLFLVPIWLPCLWGVAALFVKRLCDTLLRRS